MTADSFRSPLVREVGGNAFASSVAPRVCLELFKSARASMPNLAQQLQGMFCVVEFEADH